MERSRPTAPHIAPSNELHGMQDSTRSPSEADLRTRDAEIARLRDEIAALRASRVWRVGVLLRRASALIGLPRLLVGQRVSLKPLREVEMRPAGKASTTLQFHGSDPQIELNWQHGWPLLHGHYEFQIDVADADEAWSGEMHLYADTGKGYNEGERIRLTFAPTRRNRYQALFSIYDVAERLRLDPAEKEGSLTVGTTRLRRVTRLEFYTRTIRKILAAQRQAGRPLSQLLRSGWYQLRSHGVRGVAAALRSAATGNPLPLSIKAARLEPLGRLEVLLRVLADRRRTEGSIWPTLRRALGTMRREGLSHGLARLEAQAQRLAATPLANGAARGIIVDQPSYVPKTQAAPLESPVAKIIAFYLPQFHPIPLNDNAWGEGFTEWSNVRPAESQFVGHYQPHVPDELGYYDLRDPSIQRKQVELARTYGVGGFCFYFYWFGGERILEMPILNYLADQSLSLPFCLCWANENWSRRWDGLESELLISQQHSEDDDLAFIKYVAKYLRDPRYIRVDGKPLLLVYRPSLLPDMAATVERWRTWCRENGVGEIYLAYTQSFEKRDPRDYRLDAAVEFPPNNSSPPDITDQVEPTNSRFAGKVYDWTVFPERSRNSTRPDYTLFRSVNPGWDNTARRKNMATIFANSTPALYEEWLENMLVDTRAHFASQDQRLVFVNAWNEWAEGAHLEPDRRYGFAWLEATRRALESAAKVDAAPPWVEQAGAGLGDTRAAVVVHAFYLDVFDEILRYAQRLHQRHVLFVTTPASNEVHVRRRLEQSGREFVLRIVDNRGRDILPFLTVLPEIRRLGFNYLIKAHTKRSPHRVDGDAWRQQLYGALLSHDGVERALRLMYEDAEIGLLGPPEHFVPMATYYGSNRDRILELAAKLGLDEEAVVETGFFAGTMFAARTDAFVPLLSLNLQPDDFEEEEGQVDGTLAHAVERIISVSSHAAGLRPADAGTGADLKGNETFQFADATPLHPTTNNGA